MSTPHDPEKFPGVITGHRTMTSALPSPESMGAFPEDALSLDDALAARDRTEDEANHGR